MGGDVTLTWDPSVGATGYRVHSGTSPDQYTTSTDVGNVTQVNLDQLTDCTLWYLNATAYNAAGESSYAIEVSSWPRAIISNTNPPAAEQGRALNLTISGTNFQAGDTLQFSDPNIQVNSLSVNSCAEITASITVGSSAVVGSSDVTVTHVSGVSGSGVGLFTVALAVPPTVVSTSPLDGATGVNGDVQPTVQFSEPMLDNTISATSIRLLDAAGNPVGQAAGSPNLSADGTVATIVPAANLGDGATYRIEVLGGASGVRDLADHPMDSTFVQATGFETADPSAPQISSIQATSVTGTSAVITWTTDEPADSQVFYRRSVSRRRWLRRW
jgi:hypothetical protein